MAGCACAQIKNDYAAHRSGLRHADKRLASLEGVEPGDAVPFLHWIGRAEIRCLQTGWAGSQGKRDERNGGQGVPDGLYEVQLTRVWTVAATSLPIDGTC